MDHRKYYAESQAGTDRPRSGRTAPRPYVGPAERGSHAKSPRTGALSSPEATGGRKRLVFPASRPAHPTGLHHAVAREQSDPQSELHRLSTELLTVQEKERQRIAADLHDGIGQSLSLIKLSMESGLQLMDAGERDSGLELLRGVVPKLYDAIAELRRTTSDLRPPMLDDLGIIPTLSWFFRELGPVCRGKRIEPEITIAEKDVPAPIKAAIFRILQEAMNNVLKHANADVVKVCLKKSGSGIHFSIEDNGLGFDPEPASACRRCGLGMLTMKERAMCSGGIFEVESGPGHGTRIAVTWPPGAAAKPDLAAGPAAAARPMKNGMRATTLTARVIRRARGFTLLELLVVMVIIGLLAGYVGPKYFSQIGKSQVKTARAQIDALGKALDQFRLDTGHYPTMEEGLQGLVTRPSSEAKWDGPYLTKAVPLDPWGNPYVFKIPGDHGEYDLMSYGKDGHPGGDGEAADITNW